MTMNRLTAETSPYLLQHAANPVHWWAWGPEALAEAKRTGRPIMLSIGYAACHWCHVMAHESFEDDATAAVMNEHFVNIKVDREERPDIDAIYMAALHRLGQQGGWPLTMFLDADARPFWGGTYFPKERAWGRPAFTDILHRVSEIYRTEPAKVANNAEALVAAISEIEPPAASATLSEEGLRDLVSRMARAVDPVHGGVNGAPKFPQWTFFSLLWRGAIRYRDDSAKTAVLTTLEQIAQGGIYDHLGGGFSRYSVDELWLVPHFEKMLYDNALLIDLLTEAWRETKSPLFEARIAETVAWIEREMIADGGAFAASLDADSEGEEGKFYVWTAAEIEAVLGAEDAETFGNVYGVTPHGNFEGHTILNRLDNPALLSDHDETHLARLREKLLEARVSRIRPGWDDKVLADWNGLMIAALARAGCVFDRPSWVTLAKTAFTFITEKMTVGDRLVHSWRDARSSAPATASDYANMIWGARRLFEATASEHYLDWAKRWTSALDRHHWLDKEGGYATAADDTTDVIARLRPGTDDATPPANSIMLSNLAALAVLTGDEAYIRRAEDLLRAFAGGLARNPIAHCGMAGASLDLKAPMLIVVANDAKRSSLLAAAMRDLSLPGAIEIEVSGAGNAALTTPALDGKLEASEAPRAFICNGPSCSPPQSDPAELRKRLEAHRQAF